MSLLGSRGVAMDVTQLECPFRVPRRTSVSLMVTDFQATQYRWERTDCSAGLSSCTAGQQPQSAAGTAVPVGCTVVRTARITYLQHITYVLKCRLLCRYITGTKIPNLLAQRWLLHPHECFATPFCEEFPYTPDCLHAQMLLLCAAAWGKVPLVLLLGLCSSCAPPCSSSPHRSPV